MNITVWAKTNKVGSESETSFEIDKEEWDNMSEEDREDLCREHLENIIEWGWEESK